VLFIFHGAAFLCSSKPKCIALTFRIQVPMTATDSGKLKGKEKERKASTQAGKWQVAQTTGWLWTSRACSVVRCGLGLTLPSGKAKVGQEPWIPYPDNPMQGAPKGSSALSSEVPQYAGHLKLLGGGSGVSVHRR
jgi:hypothetical protein